MIYQLKGAGINQTDLVRIHARATTLVIEYPCLGMHMSFQNKYRTM